MGSGRSWSAPRRRPGIYVFAYVDDVDWTGHHCGPSSDAHIAAATGVLDALAELAGGFRRTARRSCS